MVSLLQSDIFQVYLSNFWAAKCCADISARVFGQMSSQQTLFSLSYPWFKPPGWHLRRAEFLFSQIVEISAHTPKHFVQSGGTDPLRRHVIIDVICLPYIRVSELRHAFAVARILQPNWARCWKRFFGITEPVSRFDQVVRSSVLLNSLFRGA